MKCPVCINESLVMSERSGIEIDYCPDCRGVWLDRGELDKIIEKSRSDDSQAKPQSYSQHPQKHQSNYNEKYYKRKKSFLEEIFD